jgi:hypothetical protein
LFDGDDRMFKKFARDCCNYSEYGCGKSTFWMSKNTNANITSVDTSKDWVAIVEKQILNNKNTLVKFIDCGTVKKWGKPIDLSKKDSFIQYAEFLWKQDIKPDMVLVDGRFRVLCFLISLKHANENTKLIFDDYVDRPHYHIVEKILQPIEFDGRQAYFCVPKKEKLDLEKINLLIEDYKFEIL